MPQDQVSSSNSNEALKAIVPVLVNAFRNYQNMQQSYRPAVKGTFNNLNDLMNAQNFTQQQTAYNLQGGAGNQAYQAQQDVRQKQAADQLNAFLTLQNQYPTITPNPTVQQAAGTIMGNPAQQMGWAGPNVLPSQSAYMNQAGAQGQAKIAQTKQLMEYLTGIKDPQQQAMAQQMLGGYNLKPGQLNWQQYNEMAQDISNIPALIKQATESGSYQDENAAKQDIYYALVAKYGAAQEPKIKQALWPQGQMADAGIIAALSNAGQQKQPGKNIFGAFKDWLTGGS
jgi:putative lipoic acid-binding regulatory protein